MVILAISANKKTDIGLAYMNAREFNGPNILHGRDPLMPARLGLKSEFFNYVLIGPTGTLVESGNASRHFTDGAGTRYAWAQENFQVRESRRIRDHRRANAGQDPADALAF